MPRQTDHRITLRLKPDEYARLLAKTGDKPLSGYIREQVFGETSPIRVRHVARFQSKPLKRLS